MALGRFIIERDIPKVGLLQGEQIKGAACKATVALRELGADSQWIESLVAGDRTFWVHLAKDKAVVRKHADLSGFPATKIAEIRRMIDPTTQMSG